MLTDTRCTCSRLTLWRLASCCLALSGIGCASDIANIDDPELTVEERGSEGAHLEGSVRVVSPDACVSDPLACGFAPFDVELTFFDEAAEDREEFMVLRVADTVDAEGPRVHFTLTLDEALPESADRVWIVLRNEDGDQSNTVMVVLPR